MSDLLAWTGAIGGAVAAVGAVIAAVGAWRPEVTARWQARVQRLRTDAARRENELHRRRFTEVWDWQRSQPEGEERAKSARWFGEWTGARAPYRGDGDGPATPGLHSAAADDACERYLDFLGAVYDAPGQLGPPRPPL